MKVLPENILRAMNPKDRSPLGKAGRTSAEAEAKYEYGQERKLHQQISQLLTIRNLIFVHSRTDKRTTTDKGVPDFLIFRPNLPELCVEVKVGNGVLRTGQIGWHERYLAATGRQVQTIRSLKELMEKL